MRTGTRAAPDAPRLFRTKNDLPATGRVQAVSLLNTEISRGIDKWLWFVEAQQQGELEEPVAEA